MADNNINEDIVLAIDVRYEEAIERIADYTQRVQDLKKVNADAKKENKELSKSNKDLRKAYEEGLITTKKYTEELSKNEKTLIDNNKAIESNNVLITQHNEATRLMRREIQNNIKIEREQEGSILRLQAQIANLNRDYEKLGNTESDLAKKKDLLVKINGLQDSLNNANEARQRFQHNVGNYEGAIVSAAAGNNVFAQSLLQASMNGKGMGGVVDMVKGKVLALFQAMLANPVIAILAAIVIVFMAIKKAINSSEEATDKLNKVLAPLNMLLDALLNIIQKVVGSLLDGVLMLQKFALALAKLAESLPVVGDLFKEVNKHIEKSIELEQRKAKLEARTRAVQEQNAKYSRDVAKLRAEAEDKLNHTAEERLKFIRQANKLEKASADNALAIAKEKLSIAEEEASRAENTKETERELAKLRAEVYKAEEDHFNKVRSLSKKESAILTEITNDEKQRLSKINENAKKYAEKQKAIQEKELAATIEIQNLKFESEIKHQKDIADNQDKTYQERVNALYLHNTKMLEVVKYNEEQELKQADLTSAQKDLIQLKANQRITELQKELSDSTLQLMKDEEAKQLDVFNTNLGNKLATIKKGSEDELSLRLQQLNIQEQAEIESAEKSGADIALIREKYRQLELQEQEKQDSYLAGQKQKEFQNKMLEAQLNGQNTLAILLEQKTAEIEAIKQLEGENDIDFLNRKLSLQNELKVIEDEYLNYQLETRVKVMEATATIAGSFQELFQSMADSNTAFAAFAKAMALYQIGVDTAVALTTGIKQAQAVPFPGNIAAIAAVTATILSSIAKAKKFLTAEKQPKAPKFNQGGLVMGEGSGTSDSIRAFLSNGESVMTARTTSMFSPILSAFNQIGGGVPISTQDTSSQVMGEEMLSRAFANAVTSLPNPVVSVQEIDTVNNRIEVLESSRSL